MRLFRLWMMVVLILFVAAPNEARAEKHLGVTEKQFIVHCNSRLNADNLRFIKDAIYKEFPQEAGWTASYHLNNGVAHLLLAESAGHLVRVHLTARGGDPVDTPIILPAVVLNDVVSAVLPSVADRKRFNKQLNDKLLQGLNKFVITVGGKSFDLFNNTLVGEVSLFITPAK